MNDNSQTACTESAVQTACGPLIEGSSNAIATSGQKAFRGQVDISNTFVLSINRMTSSPPPIHSTGSIGFLKTFPSLIFHKVFHTIQYHTQTTKTGEWAASGC